MLGPLTRERGKPLSARRQWPRRALPCALAYMAFAWPFHYSGLGRSGLSSWSIGGHSPLLQRSQNFLLRIADVELVPLAIGPPSPPQAASVSTAARSIPAAIHLEPGCIEISAPRCGGLDCRRIPGRTGAHRAWSPRSVAALSNSNSPSSRGVRRDPPNTSRDWEQGEAGPLRLRPP